jgi:hypothetical protein
MLSLRIIADETGSILCYYIGECPIRHKFMSEFIRALHTPEEVVNGFIHAAVVDLA